jgi:hypothetical protein
VFLLLFEGALYDWLRICCVFVGEEKLIKNHDEQWREGERTRLVVM